MRMAITKESLCDDFIRLFYYVLLSFNKYQTYCIMHFIKDQNYFKNRVINIYRLQAIL